MSIKIAQHNLRSTGALKFRGLVVDREFILGVGTHWNPLPDTGVGNTRTFEGDGERSLSLAEIAGIEQQAHSILDLVGPVEAAVQDVETEVAVHDQVVGTRQVRGQVEWTGNLFPRRRRCFRTPTQNQEVYVVE